MSETLCTLRTKGGGGGKYTETILWTNPSPSANFPQTTVTLSDSMNNYTYLGLEFKYSNDSTDTMTYYMKVEDFSKQATTGAGSMQVRFGGVGSITISRYVVKTSDTSITIGNGTQVGGTTTSTTIGIPLYIYGINELDHGKLVMDSGTFTVASGVTDTITCGFRPKKIYIYNLVGTTSIFVNIYDENVSSTYTIGAYRSSSSANGCNSYALGGGNNGVIQSITDTGFTFKGSTVMSTLYYTAIG